MQQLTAFIFYHTPNHTWFDPVYISILQQHDILYLWNSLFNPWFCYCM